MISRHIRITALALCLSVGTLTGCGPKPNVDPTTGQPVPVSSEQIIAHIKEVTANLSIAVDEGIALEATLAAQGMFSGPDVDPNLEANIRRWLKDGKISIDAFNARLATYTKFDGRAKADVAKFADDAIALISKLNDEGVLRIKNPRSQLIAGGIIAGARVAARILKSYADRQITPLPPTVIR